MPHKITIVSPTFPPEKGASPSRMLRLASLLKDHGYDVEVISFMPNYPTGKIFKDYRGKLIHKEELNSIKLYRIWAYPSNSNNLFARVFSVLTQALAVFFLALPRLMRRRPESVIINTPPLLSAYAALIISRLIGAKILLNISDLWPLSMLELGVIQQGPFYSTLQWIERRLYKKADAYVCQSMEIVEHVHRTVPKDKKSFLYYNLQKPGSGGSHFPNGKRKIVYAGLLGVAQGVYDICKNVDFAALGLELHIYGEGNEKEKLPLLLAENPQRGIFYHGSIAAEEVPYMLSQYHATLIPLKTSIHGALPSKIFMAVANGLPVFFSGNGEGAKIVRGNEIGWVNAAGDFDGLKQNLILFCALPDEALDAIRCRCATLNNQHFSIEKQEERFIDFLQQTVLAT